MAIISMSVPEALVAEMDGAIAEGAYKGRSEFMRAAVRALLQQRHVPGGDHVHGSITVTYPHGHEVKLSDARHAYHDVVLSMMHTHCEAETCMDVLIVGGDSARVRELQETLSRMREIHRSHLAIMA